MKTQKTGQIISYLLPIMGTIIYLSLIFNNNVWLDEAFTASLVRTDMAGVIQRSMADTLPPLYNIILKIMTDIFGYTIPVMKIVSITPIILTMVLSATVIKRRHGVIVSSLFTLCLMSMPMLLFYGVEIRMYSLGFYFATASGIFSYECLKDSSKKNWIIFTIFSVLAGYSHHFAFVTVGFVYLYMLIFYIVADRENIKRWFLCLFATFILYFPCLIVTLKQFKSVSGYFSMPEITLSVFVKYCRFPYTVGNPVLSILLSIGVIILAGLSIYNIMKKKNTMLNMYALVCFLILYGVLVFGTIISKIMTANIFVDRYLFFSVGLIWLFFSIEINELYSIFKSKESSRYFLLIPFIFVILCGIIGYIKEYKIEYSESASEEIEFLNENVQDGDILYTIEDAEEMAYCLPFYNDKLTNIEDLDEAVSLADINNSNLWLTVIDYYDYDFSELSKYSLTPEYIGDFTFDRYTFSLYKLIK